MSRVLYFAYGSNMSERRLQARAPSARRVGLGQLAGHRLAFHKVGFRDGSAKCDIARADGETVHGVLFELAAHDLRALDDCEGAGHGYDRVELSVASESQASVLAYAYRATRIDPTLRPFTWYLRHVLAGAREAGLPAAYIEALAAVEAMADPNRQREHEELAVYE
ncbi:MAG: gamma-glutamylcyclotransferase [Planctomycetales bacterium]|nr:gamma-glutamylcyclotransferase [Planctomycetales bacterium]